MFINDIRLLEDDGRASNAVEIGYLSLDCMRREVIWRCLNIDDSEYSVKSRYTSDSVNYLLRSLWKYNLEVYVVVDCAVDGRDEGDPNKVFASIAIVAYPVL